ncbi:MAG: hypothetical protein AAGH40_04810 [Verrucomicrobiota bacterium]
MNNLLPSRLTRLSVSLFLLAVTLSGVARAEVPAFVSESLYSPFAAKVSEVVPSLSADVVILNGGLEQGLRIGMVCRVDRGPLSIGEIIIIESESRRAAALILDLADDVFLKAGDVARVKTIQSS